MHCDIKWINRSSLVQGGYWGGSDYIEKAFKPADLVERVSKIILM